MGNKILHFTFLTIAATCLLAATSLNTHAQDTSRKGYSIFKPMPKALMREEMETDRPSITETPHTVEAGHFQLETDLFKMEHQVTETNEHHYLINQANMKFGLFTNTALQVIVQSFGHQTSEEVETGEKESGHGFGDITVRLKQNIYGNY
jgi:hypothetical protein